MMIKPLIMLSVVLWKTLKAYQMSTIIHRFSHEFQKLTSKQKFREIQSK